MGILEPESREQKRGETGNVGSDETPASTGPALTGSGYAQSESPMSLTTTVLDESEPAVNDAASPLPLEPPTDDYRTTRQ